MQVILDLGELPRVDKENRPFSLLLEQGAAHGTRVSIDPIVLPATSTFLDFLAQMEARWAEGDFRVGAVFLWVMPESGWFIRHCHARGLDAEAYWLAILERSRALNARFGAWRVTLHARGEYDSCFPNFDADWTNREAAAQNWERVNDTELGRELYTRFGDKRAWGPTPEGYPVKSIPEFFRRRGLCMSDYPLDVGFNMGFGIHAHGRWGWPSINVENFCESTWNSHLLMAAVRGAARQFGLHWGCDFSPWGAPFTQETTYDRDGHWLGGMSAGLNLRAFMMALMNGAEYVLAEVADRTYFTFDGDLAQLELDNFGGDTRQRQVRDAGDISPMGRAGIEFERYVFDRHPERGQAWTPIAGLMDSRCGFNARSYSPCGDKPGFPKPDDYPYKIWFGWLKPEPQDWMMAAFFRTAFSAEPVFGWPNDCWRHVPGPASGAPSAPETRQARLELLRSGQVPIEDAEAGMYLGTSRWGDSLDLLVEDVSLDVLRQYPLTVLLGALPDDDVLWERLRAYVEDGGVLVANVAQVPARVAPWFGVRWDANNLPATAPASGVQATDATPWSVRVNQPTAAYVVKRGNGAAWLTTRAWAVTSPHDFDPHIATLLDQLYADVSPIRIIGAPVHYAVNRLEMDGWSRCSTISAIHGAARYACRAGSLHWNSGKINRSP